MKIKLTRNRPMSFIDYPDPKNWCTSIYMVGCDANCVGCHNKELQDENYSEVDEYNLEELFEMLSTTGDLHRTKCVTILGGEPLRYNNIEQVKAILEYNYNNELGFKFAVYTGYGVDHALGHNLTDFEYLKTGLYKHDLKVDEVKNKRNLGSSNQKMYDKDYILISKEGVLNTKHETPYKV